MRFSIPNEGSGWFIICLISLLLVFYNETGSRSSGGLETSYNTTFSITPWHKYQINQTYVDWVL